MGMLFESIKQPVINGYLVAGAIVGPGGLQLIKELVQVRNAGAAISSSFKQLLLDCMCCCTGHLLACLLLWACGLQLIKLLGQERTAHPST
jgi:hypothetical protein